MKKKVLSPNQCLIDEHNMQIVDKNSDNQNQAVDSDKDNAFDFDNDGIPDGAEKERHILDVPLSVNETGQNKNKTRRLPDVLVNGFVDEQQSEIDDDYDFD